MDLEYLESLDAQETISARACGTRARGFRISDSGDLPGKRVRRKRALVPDSEREADADRFCKEDSPLLVLPGT